MTSFWCFCIKGFRTGLAGAGVLFFMKRSTPQPASCQFKIRCSFIPLTPRPTHPLTPLRTFSLRLSSANYGLVLRASDGCFQPYVFFFVAKPFSIAAPSFCPRASGPSARIMPVSPSTRIGRGIERMPYCWARAAFQYFPS